MKPTVGNRLIIRYQFEPLEKPGITYTNILKAKVYKNGIQIWITNGEDKYAGYRLSEDQTKQLIGFLQNAVNY